MPAASLVGTALSKTIWNRYSATFRKSDRKRVTHFGSISHPCCIIDPTVSQIQLCMFQIFSNSSASSSHGCGFSQSAAAILRDSKKNIRLRFMAHLSSAIHILFYTYSSIYRAKTTSTIEMHKKAVAICIHTSSDNGSMNENNPLSSFSARTNKTSIPSAIKALWFDHTHFCTFFHYRE